MNVRRKICVIAISCLVSTTSVAQEQLSPSVNYPLPSVNETKIETLGIRKVSGEHLILYTDLPSSAAIDELPRVFDTAIPSWCAYFRLSEHATSRWKVIGSLMRDKERFIQAGLLPTDLPPFLNGYQRGSQIWWYEQPSDYYRRHLMLHEGTHATGDAPLARQPTYARLLSARQGRGA
jgi:hypothetical protein